MPSRFRRESPSFRPDGAVSDIVGSVLLVGLTVAMTVVLGFLLLTYDGPRPEPHASLALSLDPGAGGWGTGDERVVLRHLGGDAVPASAHVVVAVGATTTDLTGAALGGPFADGRLAIGETWSRAWTIRASDVVEVDVVGGGEAPRLLATLTVLAGGSP